MRILETYRKEAMNEIQDTILLNARREAKYHLLCIEKLCEIAEKATGESDMTADYIWGNCTLEELLKELDAARALKGS